MWSSVLRFLLFVKCDGCCDVVCISEFFLLVDQVIHGRAMVQLFILNTLYNVIVVIPVKILQLLGLLGVDHDLRGVK